MRSLTSFQLRGKLTSNGTSVWISNDILTDTALTFTNETILLKSDDESIKELMVASASWGTLTISQRGLDQSRTKTTDSSLQQEFRTGTIWRIVASASDLADLDDDNIWTGDHTHTAGQTTYTSTTEAQDVAQNVTTTQRDALTGVSNGARIYNTTTGQTEWREWGAWVANAVWGTVVDMSETAAGKWELGTQAESDAGTEFGWTGAPIVSNPLRVWRSIQKNAYIYAVDSGVADAYVITLTPAPTAYTEWGEFLVKITNENTWPCTLNVNSLGAVNIKDLDGLDIASGQLEANATYKFRYDGTNFVVNIKDCIKANASESITAWDVVFINQSGTISKYRGTQYWSDSVSYLSWSLQNASIIQLTSTKLVFVYRVWSATDLQAVVWDISSGQITFWSSTSVGWTIWSNDTVQAVRVDSDKFAVCYDYASPGWAAKVGTVSWTTITFWSSVQFDSNANISNPIRICSTWTDKIVIAFVDNTDSDVYCIAATISWTTLSFWTRAQIVSWTVWDIDIVDVDTDKFVVLIGESSSIWSRIWTISWTTISYSANNSIETSGANSWATLTKVDSSYVIVTYTLSGQAYARYMDVSWATPSEQSRYEVSGTDRIWKGITWNVFITGDDDLMYWYAVDTTNYEFTLLKTVNIQALEVGTWANLIFPALISTNLVFYVDSPWSTSATVYMSDVAFTKYVAKNTEGSGEFLKLSEWIDKNQSWLTPGFVYYADIDGTLTTNPTDTLTNTLDEIGTALSATSLILK